MTASTRIYGLLLVNVSAALVFDACSIAPPSTDGLLELAPTTWSAVVDCGDGERFLDRGEVVELDNGWSCVPVDPEQYMGWVKCWRGDAEFTLSATCEPGFYRSMAYVEHCRVEITCEGGQGQ